MTNDLALALTGAAALSLLLPLVRPLKAGYGAVSFYVLVEIIMIFVAPQFGGTAWLAPVGWGIIAVLATLADIGADLRRALEKKATSGLGSSPPPVGDRAF